MKKFMAMLSAVAMVFILASCAQEPDPSLITMEDIIAANRTEALLGKHDRISVSVTVNDQPEAIYYAEKSGQALCEYPNRSYYAIVDEDCHYTTEPDGSGSRHFSAGGEIYVYWYDSMMIDRDLGNQEVITDIQKTEENMIVTTRVEGTVYDEISNNEFGTTAERISVYDLDSKTLHINSCFSTVIYRDGTTKVVSSQADYAAERPEALDEIATRAKQTVNVRTVTVVVDPGTENEKTYSVSVPKGDGAVPHFTEEYGYKLYLDVECTQRYYGGTDMTKDLTIYVPANN